MEPGTLLALPGGVRLTCWTAYPRPARRPSRLWRARTDPRGRRAARTCRCTGTPIALRLPAAATFAARRATRTSTPTEPGSAEMASAGRPFTERVLVAADGPRRPGRPAHAAHRRLQPGAARAALARAVRRPGGHRPAGQQHPAGRRRVVAVGTTVTRALETATDDDGVTRAAERLDRPRARPRPAGPRGDRPDHRPARAGGQPPAAARGGRRRRTWSARPTTPPSPSATSGTSSATRCCSCPERRRRAGAVARRRAGYAGGYYLVEAADLDEALAIAKQVPAPLRRRRGAADHGLRLSRRRPSRRRRRPRSRPRSPTRTVASGPSCSPRRCASPATSTWPRSASRTPTPGR